MYLVQSFLSFAAIVLAQEDYEAKETLYLFPTQPYVLSVPAREGHVLLKTSPDGHLAVSHMDHAKGEWSAPQPISQHKAWSAPSVQHSSHQAVHAQAYPQTHAKTAYAPGPQNFQMAPQPQHQPQAHHTYHASDQAMPQQATWQQPAMHYHQPPNSNQYAAMAANPMLAGLWIDDKQNKNMLSQDGAYADASNQDKAVAGAGKSEKDDKKKGKDDKDKKSKKSSKSKKDGGSSTTSAKTGKKNKTKKENSATAFGISALAIASVSALSFFGL